MMSNASAAVVPVTTTASASPIRTADPPRILLVDDDELALIQLGQVLELNGLRCVTARSALDALIYCDRHRPHVIVTDLTMPGLDGGVLARWLKARDPSVPIILVTGQDLTDPAIGALRGTVAAILAKPVNLEQLVDLLNRLTDDANRREDASGRP